MKSELIFKKQSYPNRFVLTPELVTFAKNLFGKSNLRLFRGYFLIVNKCLIEIEFLDTFSML